MNKKYIIISSIDWDENWQIHQQLALALANDGARVLFIENTGVRGIKLSDIGRILIRLKNRLKSSGGYINIKNNITLLSPLFIPLPYNIVANYINLYIIGNSILRWMKIVDFYNPIIISFSPSPFNQSLINKINNSLSIYYCADDISGRSLENRINKYESKFIKNVDAVFCTSNILLNKCKKINNNTYFFPSGVDVNLFYKFQGDIPVSVLDNICSPIIGFIGAINKFIDLNLIYFLADKFKNFNFVLIGPKYDNVNIKNNILNIYYFESQPYEMMPVILNKFDVGIIPMVVNEVTNSIYSVKLQQYLAVGLPVVSTDAHEIKLFSESNNNIVEIANNYEDFAIKINKSLNENNKKLIEERVRISKLNSFDNKFINIKSIIVNLLDNKNIIYSSTDWFNIFDKYHVNNLKKIYKIIASIMIFFILSINPIVIKFFGDKLIINSGTGESNILVLFVGNGEPNYSNFGYQNLANFSYLITEQRNINKIIISSGKGDIFSEAEVVSALLQQKNIPDHLIYKINKITNSTYENVLLTNNIIVNNKIDSILFVTSPLHSLRSLLIWSKINPNLNVIIVNKEFNYFDENSHFLTSIYNSWYVILYEYSAISYYWYKGYI